MGWTIRRALLSYDREGYSLRIEDTPWWAAFAETAGEEIHSQVCRFANHFLCSPPDFFWDLGWGRYEWEYGMWEHSLAGMFTGLGHHLAGGFGAWRRSKHVGSVRVSEEWVAAHFPDWLSPEEDEMQSAPGDGGDVRL